MEKIILIAVLVGSVLWLFFAEKKNDEHMKTQASICLWGSIICLQVIYYGEKILAAVSGK